MKKGEGRPKLAYESLVSINKSKIVLDKIPLNISLASYLALIDENQTAKDRNTIKKAIRRNTDGLN